MAVVCVAPPQELTGDARANLERLPGTRPVRLDGTAWKPSDDGQQTPRLAPEPLRRARERRRRAARHRLRGRAARRGRARRSRRSTRAGAPVVSVDVPSGVDARPATSRGAAVRARCTVTFHAAKPGLWIDPGKAHAGEVETYRHRHPARRPRRRVDRADRAVRARAAAAQSARRRRSSRPATCSSSAARAG